MTYTHAYTHGGNVALASRLYGLKPDAFLDFSANINPFGPSQIALDAVKESFGAISRYPDPQCSQIRNALSRYLDVDAGNILVGNGANELIHLVVKAVKPSTALIVAPTFSEYRRAVEIEGGSARWFPVSAGQNFRPQMNDLAEQVPGADMLFICNPNNPSGCILYRNEFFGVLDSARDNGALVIVDEAFVDFVEKPSKVTLRYEAVSRDNLLVLGSLTKFFALPGLRLGYAVGHKSLIGRLWQIKDPWSVNCLAQAGAIASIKDEAYIRKTREWVEAERRFLSESLSNIRGVEVYPPSANYVFIDLRGTGFTAARLQEHLGPKGILIRDCSNYPFLDEYYARVAVRTRQENITLLAILEDVLVG